MSITSFELDALKPKDKPYLIRDKQHHKNDGVLMFQVLPSGDIDAYFAYYSDGRERRKKLGRYGKAKGLMSLKELRDAYLELSKQYKQGFDVKKQEQLRLAEQERQRQELEEAELRRQMQGSLGQLIELYLCHAEEKLSQHYVKVVRGAFSNNLKEFDMTRKADSITRDDIIRILHPIRERGSLIMANRMRSYLQSLFKFGIEFDKDSEGVIRDCVLFYIKDNPVNSIPKAVKKEAPVERYLEIKEVSIFWNALNQCCMDGGRVAVFKLMLSTGARLEALSGLQWHEINWVEGYITIPKERSKNGKIWVIPMGEVAFDILQNVPKTHDTYLFPAGNGLEPLRLDGFSQAITRLCAQFNIEPFTPRDLRRTFKSLSGKAGLSKEIRDRLQNHSFTDVSSKHYDHYDYLHEKRHAMTVWDTYLKGIITNNVVPIRKIGMK